MISDAGSLDVLSGAGSVFGIEMDGMGGEGRGWEGR